MFLFAPLRLNVAKIIISDEIWITMRIFNKKIRNID